MMQRRNIFVNIYLQCITYSGFWGGKNPIFIGDVRHALPWRRAVSNVRCGIFPEIVVSMETVTHADNSIQEKKKKKKIE